MNGNISIASESDLEAILDLQKEAFYDVAKAENNFNIMPMVQTLDEMTEEFKEKTFMKYVADDSIVGSVRAFIDSEGSCHIGRLIVKPEYQKKGIGTELMGVVEKYCSAAKKFTIFTSKSSVSTIRLYTKLGFAIVNEVEEDNTIMVIMEKIHS